MSVKVLGVTIGTTGQQGTIVLSVQEHHVSALMDWMATGKERTHTVRGRWPTAISDDAPVIADVLLNRDHVAYIVINRGAW